MGRSDEKPLPADAESTSPMSRRFSQFGEDVLLHNLILLFGNDLCAQNIIEMGAGDPFDLSNSRMLIDLGWQAFSIEANPELVARLHQEYASTPQVHVRQALISDAPRRCTILHIEAVVGALRNRPGVTARAAR